MKRPGTSICLQCLTVMLRYKLSTCLQEKISEQCLLDDSARRRLAEVITPLLQLMSEATGLSHLTLIGGCPPKTSTDKYIVSVVYHGTTNETMPRDFFQFDREDFRANILGYFCKFLTVTTGKFV